MIHSYTIGVDEEYVTSDDLVEALAEFERERAELNAERGRICDAEGKPLWDEDEQQPTLDALELAKEALHRVEWYISMGGRAFCPVCDKYEKDGHSPDCIVGKALEALENRGKLVEEPSGKCLTISFNEDDLIESLAELEHKQWVHWTRYMLDNHLDVSHIARWRRQTNTPYSELSEQEKESDRAWAKKILEVIRTAKTEIKANDEPASSPEELRRDNATGHDWKHMVWSIIQPLDNVNQDVIMQEIWRLKSWSNETWAMGEVVERALITLNNFKKSSGRVETIE